MVSAFSRLRDDHLEDILEVIDDVMADHPAESSLAEMGRYHMSTGGKRLRAMLPLAVAEALEADPSDVVPFAAACELLHNATLVHDDLQDGDRVRRQQEAIWSKFGSERAINLGDAMLYWPIVACDRLEVSADQKHRTVQRIVRSTLDVIDGQEREFLLQRRFVERDDDVTAPPEPQTYIRMVEGKTGGLFALPLVGAADLSNAATEVMDGLSTAATHLGVLFQIQDDVLDLYGDKGRDHRGADIEEGKISALVVYHLARTEFDATCGGAWIRDILARDRGDTGTETIDEVAATFQSSGALEAACDEIHRRRELATNQPPLRDHPGLEQLIEAIAGLMLAPIDHVLDHYPRTSHE